MIEEKETTATIEKFILLNANYGHFVCTQCFIELIYKNGRFNFLPGDTEIPNITRPIAQRA